VPRGASRECAIARTIAAHAVALALALCAAVAYATTRPRADSRVVLERPVQDSGEDRV